LLNETRQREVPLHRDRNSGALCAIAFLIGFVFGTIRVLVLAPPLGETAAVVLLRPTGGQFLARIGLHLNTPSEIYRVAQHRLAL
jgi:hypothetical protein